MPASPSGVFRRRAGPHRSILPAARAQARRSRRRTTAVRLRRRRGSGIGASPSAGRCGCRVAEAAPRREPPSSEASTARRSFIRCGLAARRRGERSSVRYGSQPNISPVHVRPLLQTGDAERVQGVVVNENRDRGLSGQVCRVFTVPRRLVGAREDRRSRRQESRAKGFDLPLRETTYGCFCRQMGKWKSK